MTLEGLPHYVTSVRHKLFAPNSILNIQRFLSDLEDFPQKVLKVLWQYERLLVLAEDPFKLHKRWPQRRSIV